MVALIAVMGYVAFVSLKTDAAPSIPYKVNFQGRLTNAAGAPVADGLYNLQFRLYDAASAGTQLWTETRETTNRVQVTNGLFSVQLGDVTALSPTLFNNTAPRYFEITMATPATATCSTAACAAWESPMTPRQPLGSAAYAFNADTVDGIDGANLATLNGTNTFTGSTVFNAGVDIMNQLYVSSLFTAASNTLMSGNVLIDGANSATKFRVKNVSNTDIFTVDTTNTIVKVGTTGSGTLSNVRLLTTDAEFSGTVRIGTATNGVDISGTNGVVLSGTARPLRTASFIPEYGGATFTADGTNNNGTLTSDFCSGSSRLNINTSFCAANDQHNFYSWSNTQVAAQDYDIYVRYRMPADYSTGSMANLRILARGSTASEILSLNMFKDTNTACSTLADGVTSATTWVESTIASPLGACSIAAGDVITLRISLSATQNNAVQAGAIRFEYRSAF